MVARDAVRTTSQVQIETSGTQLSADDLARITRVEIDSSMHLPDTATIQFHDSDYELIEEASWAIGKPLKVLMGDSEELVALFEGEITGVEAAIDAEGLGSVTFRAYDKSHRLHRGRKSQVFLQSKDSGIVSKVVRSAGLSMKITNTTATHKYVLQDNQTDWEFITERARRNGMDLWVSEGKLHMAPPPNTGSPIDLHLGEQLRSLNARLSAAGQAAKVEVRGWNVTEKKAIVGKASANDAKYIPQIGESKKPGAIADTAFGKASVAISSETVRLHGEATALAKAALNDIAGDAIFAEGETRGDVRLRPGVRVKIDGAGTTFNGTYLLTEVRHIFDATGFRQEFVAAGRHSTDLLSLVAPPPALPVPQIRTAIVTDNNDPDKLGRVKVTFPTLPVELDSDWCRLLTAGAGPEAGLFWIPEVDDEVLVIGSDMDQLFVLGSLWNGKDKPPPAPGAPDATGGEVQITSRVIRSRSGHLIELRDEEGSERILIRDKSEKNFIVFDTKAESITIESAKDITLKAKGDIKLDATGKLDIVSKGAMSLKGEAAVAFKAGQGLAVEAGTDLKLKGGTALSAKGLNVAIEATAKVSLKGGAMAEIKGAIVKIN
ncbi:MAG: VgrG-related protein [Dehalococcoidia bacterium]